jgi:hypothetical protein
MKSSSWILILAVTNVVFAQIPKRGKVHFSLDIFRPISSPKRPRAPPSGHRPADRRGIFRPADVDRSPIESTRPATATKATKAKRNEHIIRRSTKNPE